MATHAFAGGPSPAYMYNVHSTPVYKSCLLNRKYIAIRTITYAFQRKDPIMVEVNELFWCGSWKAASHQRYSIHGQSIPKTTARAVMCNLLYDKLACFTFSSHFSFFTSRSRSPHRSTSQRTIAYSGKIAAVTCLTYIE